VNAAGVGLPKGMLAEPHGRTQLGEPWAVLTAWALLAVLVGFRRLAVFQHTFTDETPLLGISVNLVLTDQFSRQGRNVVAHDIQASLDFSGLQ